MSDKMSYASVWNPARLYLMKQMTTCVAVLLAALCMTLPAEASDRVLQLGTSEFSVLVPDHYVQGEVKDSERADDMVAYYRSDKSLLDFDVYQFSKKDYPKDLAAFAGKEASEYKATARRDEINQIPVAYYYAVEEYEGKTYLTLTYIFDTQKEYVELAFWLDGNTAEQEAQAIISTLKRNR